MITNRDKFKNLADCIAGGDGTCDVELDSEEVEKVWQGLTLKTAGGDDNDVLLSMKCQILKPMDCSLGWGHCRGVTDGMARSKKQKKKEQDRHPVCPVHDRHLFDG